MTFVLADTAGIIGAATGVILVVLAVIGFIVRFRPQFEAKIDKRRQAILVKVSNKGRLEGRINAVSVIGSDDLEIPSTEFAGLPDGKFHSGQVSRKQERSLVVNAEKGRPFPDDVRVFVKWGIRREREIEPLVTDDAYYGTTSNWPPKD